MQALKEWIGNIVILILIAVMLELLIPNVQLHKYVKMVIGLLLILILLSPLFAIFSIDNKAILLENIKFEQKFVTEDFLEKKINQQKKDIEAAQSAYIEEQMAVQMKQQVEEELMQQYEMNIDQLTIEFDSNKQQNYENIQSITVLLSKSTNKINKITRVEKVVINRDAPVRTLHNDLEKEIKQFLADKWEVDEEKLIIDVDGREHS